jgi:RNA polymerase sigma-70 factor, ECF subfamily
MSSLNLAASCAQAPVAAPAPVTADSAARLRALTEANFKFIHRVLRRLLPPGAADDATQRTFMIAASKVDQIALGAERAWLFQTAIRVAHHERRTAARHREVPDDECFNVADPAEIAEEQALRQERLRMLDWVLARIPVELRSVFVLFELEGLSSIEIAPMLELPVGTVASRLRRAREQFHAEAKRIRSRLEFEGESP